jgi:hypothetical protein
MGYVCKTGWALVLEKAQFFTYKYVFLLINLIEQPLSPPHTNKSLKCQNTDLLLHVNTDAIKCHIS